MKKNNIRFLIAFMVSFVVASTFMMVSCKRAQEPAERGNETQSVVTQETPIDEQIAEEVPDYGDDELGKILNKVAKDGYWFKDGKKPSVIENNGYRIIVYKPFIDENGKVRHYRQGSAPLDIDGKRGTAWPILWLHDDGDDLREGIEVTLSYLRERKFEEDNSVQEDWRSFLEQPMDINGIEIKDSYKYPQLDAILLEDKQVIVVGYHWQDGTIDYMFKLK